MNILLCCLVTVCVCPLLLLLLHYRQHASPWAPSSHSLTPPVSSFIQKVVAVRIKVETIFRPHIHFQDTFHSFCRFPFCCSVCCCGCVFMWCCNMLYYFAKPTLKLYSWPPPVCLWLSDIRTLIGWSSKHPASHPTAQINSEYKLLHPLRFLPPSPASPSPAPRL